MLFSINFVETLIYSAIFNNNLKPTQTANMAINKKTGDLKSPV